MVDILGDLFGNSDVSYYLREVLATIATLSWLIYLFSTLLGIAVYVLRCYLKTLVGRKAGYYVDWQAYIPFVKEYYEIVMIGDSWWKMFYRGSYVIVVLFIIAVIAILSPVFASILLLAYLGSGAYFITVYFMRLYKGFGFHPALALSRYAAILEPARAVINLIIAVSSRVTYDANRAYSPYASNAQPVMYNNQYAAQPYPMAVEKSVAVGLTGMYKDATFDLSNGAEIVFGRDASACNVVFDQFNAKISRKHCGIRFRYDTNSFLITDYSKNGVYYEDGRQLDSRMPVSVPRGTTIYLGSKENMFVLK